MSTEQVTKHLSLSNFELRKYITNVDLSEGKFSLYFVVFLD